LRVVGTLPLDFGRRLPHIGILLDLRARGSGVGLVLPRTSFFGVGQSLRFQPEQHGLKAPSSAGVATFVQGGAAPPLELLIAFGAMPDLASSLAWRALTLTRAACDAITRTV
jgi:hypothetical protein